jgi:hypothetical protein
MIERKNGYSKTTKDERELRDQITKRDNMFYVASTLEPKLLTTLYQQKKPW